MHILYIIYRALHYISASTNATNTPPTHSLALMDSSHVSGGVVAAQVNIQQAIIYNQAQGIPQG